MAEITANQLLGKVKEQGGRIAELELINAVLTTENATLTRQVAILSAVNAERLEAEAKAEAEAAEVKEVAGAITEAGNARVPRSKGSKE